MENKVQPRGIRNCNPGNIRKTSDKWKGLRKDQTDKEFFQFVDMAYGYRALLRTLQNYQRRHKCKSIADFIHRWAPSSENNTKAYINNVCRWTGVHADYIVDVDNRMVMCVFASAISHVENGVEANMQEIEEGWNLL